MADEKRADADGFIGRINRETDFFAAKLGNAVVVREIAVSDIRTGKIQSSSVNCIDPAEYGHQFSRIEEGGKVIFFPLS